MAIYQVTATELVALEATSFQAAGLRERADLQRLLRERIDVISPDTLVIAEEFGEWEDSRRRIDLLGVDKEANLVVIELKRTEDGGHMELQAIRYAAMVSTMSFERAVALLDQHLRKHGRPDDARQLLLDYLAWEEPDESSFAPDVRIVLASAEFSRELTTAVMWLNERQLDIRCVRLKPYRHGDAVMLDVQQVIPLPEAAEYQVRLKEREQRDRLERSERFDLRRAFWQGLLTLARGRSSLHANISPPDANWIAASSGTPGLSFNYVIRQHDGTAELYIDRGAQSEGQSKAIFQRLYEHREEIEAAFGGPLRWERLEGKRACRIGYTTLTGGYRDAAETIRAVQEEMIDAMTRLEKAFRPHMATLRLNG